MGTADPSLTYFQSLAKSFFGSHCEPIGAESSRRLAESALVSIFSLRGWCSKTDISRRGPARKAHAFGRCLPRKRRTRRAGLSYAVTRQSRARHAREAASTETGPDPQGKRTAAQRARKAALRLHRLGEHLIPPCSGPHRVRVPQGWVQARVSDAARAAKRAPQGLSMDEISHRRSTLTGKENAHFTYIFDFKGLFTPFRAFP